MKKNIIKCIKKALLALGIVSALAATGAHAATITWTTWNSYPNGTMGSVGVTFLSGGSAGERSDYPSYTPTGTFADGTIVSNAPTSSNDIIGLTGGPWTGLNVLQFSTPVVNPVMAIWSLGSGGIQASFNFNQTPSFVCGGPSAEYGGQAITVSGNNVYGKEGNGTIEFLGTYSSLSWTNPAYEFWYGFDVGMGGGNPTNPNAPVPEPGTIMLLGAGFVGLAVYGKRRKS